MANRAAFKSLLHSRTFRTLVIGIAGLAINLWVVAPTASRFLNPVIANTLYLVIRIAMLIAIGAALYPTSKKTRVQVISLVTLAAFFDQVIWKGLWIGFIASQGAEEWRGMPVSQIAFGLAMSYLLFLPLLMIFGFLGTEIGAAIARRRKSA